MICARCPQRDVCDLAGKDDPLLTGCDASHGTWAFDRLRLDRMTADRDALRDEVEALRHEVELTNEHEHQILTERNEARAELERTKEALERVRSAGLKLLAAVDDYHSYEHDGDPWTEDARVMMEMDIDDLRASRNGPIEEIRAALERKDGA